MTRHPLTAFCLLALFARATCVFAAPPAPQPIFDGKTLAGWSGGTTEWRVEDGAITGEIAAGSKLAKNEFLYWQGEVADFELTAEFRLTGPAAANSGIQFRSERLPDGSAKGYQADIDLGARSFGNIHEERGRSVLALAARVWRSRPTGGVGRKNLVRLTITKPFFAPRLRGTATGSSPKPRTSKCG